MTRRTTKHNLSKAFCPRIFPRRSTFCTKTCWAKFGAGDLFATRVYLFGPNVLLRHSFLLYKLVHICASALYTLLPSREKRRRVSFISQRWGAIPLLQNYGLLTQWCIAAAGAGARLVCRWASAPVRFITPASRVENFRGARGAKEISMASPQNAARENWIRFAMRKNFNLPKEGALLHAAESKKMLLSEAAGGINLRDAS
jgi:hypothetical protein